MALLGRVTNAFPLWVLAACGFPLLEPALFTWFRGSAIVAGLALIMLGMGITLSLDDVRRVATRPAAVAAGVAVNRWFPGLVRRVLAGWWRLRPPPEPSMPAGWDGLEA